MKYQKTLELWLLRSNDYHEVLSTATLELLGPVHMIQLMQELGDNNDPALSKLMTIAKKIHDAQISFLKTIILGPSGPSDKMILGLFDKIEAILKNEDVDNIPEDKAIEIDRLVKETRTKARVMGININLN